MQVQHEARLLDPTPLSPSSGDDAAGHNQSPDSYSLTPQQSNILSPIEHLACGSSSSGLLAAHLSQTNQIVIFDTKSQQRRDRFPLKACDKKYSRQSFHVSAMDFSRDGQRLAVGQTDCIIYIYKLSQVTNPVANPATATHQQAAVDSPNNSKPTTICGKFSAASPITCLIWSDLGILFGSQDGRVRLILPPSGQQRTSNSTQTGATSLGEPQASQNQPTAVAPRVIQLHQAASINSVPIALSFRAPLLLVGQLDCKLNLLVLAGEQAATLTQDLLVEPSANHGGSSRRNSSIAGAPSVRQTLTISHSCPPLHVSCLANSTICCAGSDGRVAFHSIQLSHSSLTSVPLQVIDLKEDVQGADLSAVNEILAVITRRRLLFIKFDQESNSWRLQPSSIEFRLLFGLSSVLWLRDGSQLALGHSNSALDLFRCSWQKQAINEQLDICHIARNRIRITDRERNLLATYKTQYDIKRVNILDRNQSVIIWTSNSLLLARLNCQLQSEIGWPLSLHMKSAKSHQPKFLFEPSGFVLIYFQSALECHLIRLGDNNVRYSLKLPQVKRALLSIRHYPPVSELCPLNQAGGSPSGLRPGSVPHPARVDSAHSQRNSSANDLANEDSLHLLSEQSSIQRHDASQCERFAYVSGREQTQLNIVDLHRPVRLIYSKEFDAPISGVKFSCTGSYLIVREEGQIERLNLIKIKPQGKGPTETETSVGIVSKMEKCHFADWLPETDALVVQIEWTIQIWFDLEESARITRFDCRSFNYARRAPLLDLSAFPDQSQTYPRCQAIDCEPADQCESLLLSNGQKLPIDQVRRRFYAELSLGKLESAFDILQKQPSGLQRMPLFAKLGWKAIEHADCELAIRIFSRIQHSSLVSYLVRCRSFSKINNEKAAADLEPTSEIQTRDECGLMLAKLRGDWRKFEDLASDQELILTTYKRLNKWTLCLDYLRRHQQFRQRDIAESERQQWLISRGRFMEAAQLRVEHSGDLVGALELLIAQKQFSNGCDLMLAQQRVPLSEGAQLSQTDRRIREMADFLVQNLTTSSEHFKAAQLCEKVLGKKQDAIDMYLKAYKYDVAIALAKLEGAKVSQMQFDYARHLEDQARRKLIGKRRAQLALKHYTEAGSHLEALEFAAEFGFYQEAAEILEKHGQDLANLKLQSGDGSRDSLLKRFEQVAERFLSSDREANRKLASKLFELGEQYEKVVEISIEGGELKRAFEVALEKVYENDSQKTRARFLELAAQFGSERHDKQKLSCAEQIYLLLNQPGLAIEMYRKWELPERMLELIERYQPDQLESSLLQLARSLELAGRFEEAERYLLCASPTEWTSVVRMYRLAQRWPDAFRVARANCLSDEDPLLVQLAYWWARSLVSAGTQTDHSQGTHEEALASARKLLVELQLTQQVVEFCCETKNYPFAIDLMSGEAQLANPRRDIIVRYAAHLERQHKFAEAEQVLLENGLVERAARMYLDNDQHQEAVQLIEQQINEAPEGDRTQLIELLNNTLIECGRRLAESASSSFRRTPPIMRQRGATSELPTSSSNLQMAQQMFLRAQKPELAIEMYQSLGLWQEAIQVAQRFAPRFLEDVERALDAQVSHDIEPILKSQTKHMIASSQQVEKTGEQPNGYASERANDFDDSPQQSPSTRLSADELWLELSGHLNYDNRTAARASLARYLISLIGIECSPGLARHLEHLARMVGDSNNWIAITVSQQENMQTLGRLCDKIFLQADLSSSVWPSLLSLLSNLLASQTTEERHSRLQERCLIVLNVTTYGAIETLLREALSDSETKGIDRNLASKTGSRKRQSGALFARKSRRAPNSHSNTDRTLTDPKILAPIGFTIKQVESLLQFANSHRDDSHHVGEILNLLAKLSLGLLRHADQLDGGHLLLVAGRWQLALGWRKLACNLWTSLIELLDGVDEARESRQPTPDSLRICVGKLVDLPDSLLLYLGANLKQDAQQQLAEVRQWLLESLIGGQQSVIGPAEREMPAGLTTLDLRNPTQLACAFLRNIKETNNPARDRLYHLIESTVDVMARLTT